MHHCLPAGLLLHDSPAALKRLRIGRFGPKKTTTTCNEKKQEISRVIQEIQEIREEGSSKASKKLEAVLVGKIPPPKPRRSGHCPNVPAIFPNAPVATAVIAIAGHGVFSEELQFFVATKTKIFNCWDFINLNLFCSYQLNVLSKVVKHG